MKIPLLKDWLPVLFRKIDRMVNPKGLSIAELYSAVPSWDKRVPNVVYHTWKFPLVSAPHARAIRRFRRLNKDFSFEFFDDERLTRYMREFYAGQPILDVFEHVKIPAARADIWRYCVLYREGGVYCDIDSMLMTPLRTLLKDNPREVLSFEGGKWNGLLAPGVYADPSVFVSAPSNKARALLDEPEHTVLNWFLLFEKGHPILRNTIDLIVKNFPFFKDKVFDSVWKGVIHSTGPLVLTQGVWSWLDAEGHKPCQCGIDFNGQGIFKIPGAGHQYEASPHYYSMNSRALG